MFRTREQFQEIKIKAIEHMSDLRLHRRLTLPPNPKAGRPNPLRVSYSDVGAIPFGGKYADPPALLLASPFMAGRLHAAAIGELARLWGVRAVCIDKPGIGGSDPVPLEQKIRVWLGRYGNDGQSSDTSLSLTPIMSRRDRCRSA